MTNISLAMNVADNTLPGLMGANRESRMKLLNKHFRIDNFKQRRPVLQKLYNIYGLMLNVLDRPEAYVTLDTDNSGENISSVAFARLGGFHDKNKMSRQFQSRQQLNAGIHKSLQDRFHRKSPLHLVAAKVLFIQVFQ